MSKYSPEFQAFIDKAWDIYNRKGADYTIGQADIDRLANFRATADMLGISMMQAWAVHFYKHVSAVFAYCKTGKVASEGIEGRLLDIMNYAILGNLVTQEPNSAQLELNLAPKTIEALKALAGVPVQSPPHSWADRETDGWTTEHPKLADRRDVVLY